MSFVTCFMPCPGLKWHSGRQGGTSDALAAGVDSALVAQTAGWRCLDTISSYNKNEPGVHTSKAINKHLADTT